MRYRRPLSMIAAEEYAVLAKKFGVSLLELSVAFVTNKWFVGSAIIGATSVEQLRQIYNAHQTKVDPEAFKEIEAISARYLHPAA